MLLVHQAGSVKIGEVVRYTLTYTPSNDRILPTPTHLHLKIKNTSAIPLRAAWVHGPYALHVSSYPSTFNPHHKVEQPKRYGLPEYEPMLKAGGSWQAKLTVPDDIRETGADLGKRRHSMQSSHSASSESVGSMTWIIEIASQVLFSNSASVHFEVLVGRDERSLDLGFAAVAGHGHGAPGQMKEQRSEKERKRARRHNNVQTAGVYSKAVRLIVEDTETLWDKPQLPTWEDKEKNERQRRDTHRRSEEKSEERSKPKKRKRIHLVIVTHGMHSNLGADMLFLKESIDSTVKQARLDAMKRKRSYRAKEGSDRDGRPGDDGEHGGARSDGAPEPDGDETAPAPLSGGQEDLNNDAEDSDDEETTIVRGFSGNAVRTENGIQYLGKRLAKYILRFTYPDQPFLPVRKPLTRTLTDTFRSDASKAKRDGPPAHEGSSVHHPTPTAADELPYKFTSISFVGHSLGGLIQTYAVAYIHKHSPTFFRHIEPINFICMASPMLGLSNENPMYVKFALDFGLVGRTGQDLGLTWRPPTLAKGGWNAMIGGLGAGHKDQDARQEDPTAKPLLRILPTGPAHQVLRMFRNRTVYSNVVNDGIVPLRTSCLLFLDWRGLGKVDKARRENGLIGTVAEWGWAELTGANSSSLAPNIFAGRSGASDDDEDEHIRHGEGDTVPLPAEDETEEDGRTLSHVLSHDAAGSRKTSNAGSTGKAPQQDKGMLDNFLDFFRSSTPDRAKTPPPPSKKTSKALHRGQTVHHGEDELPEEIAEGREGTTSNPMMRPHLPEMQTGQKQARRPLASRGDSLINQETGELQAPPKTSIFESAGDILHPPLPSMQWITDPSTRARTIFHDRVYHPEDIPPPPVKRPGSSLVRKFSSDSSAKASQSSVRSVAPQESTDSGAMKVEEKIARAYHRDLSWRKVLVRLEPDAHNNMIVRRMFANAYGWPVVKHLCDTHFADTYAATTRDEDEPARERAPPIDKPVPETGEEVENQNSKQTPERTQSETREARDEVADLSVPREALSGSYSSLRKVGERDRQGSVTWDDSFFEGSDGDDSDVDERNLVQRLINPMPVKKPELAHHRVESRRSNGAPSTPVAAQAFTDGHRGLAPISPAVSKTPTSVKSSVSTGASFESAQVGTTLVGGPLVDEPQPLGDGVGSVGLRKSVAEQVSPSKRTSGRH